MANDIVFRIVVIGVGLAPIPLVAILLFAR